MSDDKDRDFLAAVKTTLDRGVDALDEPTLARLRRARRAALQGPVRHRTPAWLLPLGGVAATASVVMIAMALWAPRPTADDKMMLIEDAQLLSSAEELEFYQDMELLAALNGEATETLR